ncbi:MAG: hypothetical protein FJZ95_09825 [Chloroflexi bacterium]|nr:hypothetical protein [Chloroflexota bacterium]
MDFHSLTAEKIFFSLGIVNLVFGVLVFLSCRCVPMSARIGKYVSKVPGYQRFYAFHCYLWPVLWLSVIGHSVFAIKFLGNPFR